LDVGEGQLGLLRAGQHGRRQEDWDEDHGEGLRGAAPLAAFVLFIEDESVAAEPAPTRRVYGCEARPPCRSCFSCDPPDLVICARCCFLRPAPGRSPLAAFVLLIEDESVAAEPAPTRRIHSCEARPIWRACGEVTPPPAARSPASRVSPRDSVRRDFPRGCR
jgi:hypothetical protein